METIINIHVNGTLYPLNTLIKDVMPVLSQPSAINMVSKPLGDGLRTGDVFKQIRRTQTDSKVAASRGAIGGFVGATSQELHSVRLSKTSREDNIIINYTDIAKLNEAKGAGMKFLAAETGNFIITGRELDLKLLLAEAQTKALTTKLHTAFDGDGLPSGAQPADGDGTLAKGLEAISKGRRVVSLTFDASAGNVDETIDGRLQLLRKAIAYLNTLGTPQNGAEKDYLYSINGVSLSNIYILCNYEDNVAIKEKDTTRFINVSNNTMANITGIVGTVDNMIKIVQTNQLGAGTRYAISGNRTFGRDMDPTQQYIGTVRDTAAVIMRNDDKAYNLKPSERLLQFLQARVMGVIYDSEIFFLKDL